MKRLAMILMCAIMLTGFGMNVSAENTEETAEVYTEAAEESNDMSKGVKIAGFLVIFTLSMGVTAYIVMRPKIKMLKEAKQKNEEK